MSVNRIKQSTAGALSLVAIVTLITACAPARNLSIAEIRATHLSPSLSIRKDIDMVRIEGVLKSPAQADDVYKQAGNMFDATMVINDIEIDDRVASANWISPVMATVEQMVEVDDFSVHAANGQLLVGGSVSSEEIADAIAEKASSLAGVNLAVSSNLLYPTTAQEYIEVDLLAELGDEMPMLIDQPLVVAATQPEPVARQIVEQQAVALPIPSTVPVAAVSVVVPDDIPVAANEPLLNEMPDGDSDADGVADSRDLCESSRAGYPVDEEGCQVLDGYLDSVTFLSNASGLAESSEAELEEIASMMQTHPDAKIAIISYAVDKSDQQRTEARQRSFLVANYLEQRGVSRTRLQSFALSPRPGVGQQVMIKEID